MPTTELPPQLPPVTQAHRQAAFQGMGWPPEWTFARAWADPVRRRVIEARAHQLRTREAMAAGQATSTVRRFNPITGRWCTQQIGRLVPINEPDLFSTQP